MSYIKSIMDNPGDLNAGTAAAADFVAQAANIAAIVLYVVPATLPSTLFRFSAYAVVTQAATTSSTLPNFSVTYTDANSNTSVTQTVGATQTGNTLATQDNGDVVINAKPGTNVSFATASYASSGATPMQYAAHVALEMI